MVTNEQKEIRQLRLEIIRLKKENAELRLNLLKAYPPIMPRLHENDEAARSCAVGSWPYTRAIAELIFEPEAPPKKPTKALSWIKKKLPWCMDK